MYQMRIIPIKISCKKGLFDY